MGHNQLHDRIRRDERVVVMEKFNLRHLAPQHLLEMVRGGGWGLRGAGGGRERVGSEGGSVWGLREGRGQGQREGACGGGGWWLGSGVVGHRRAMGPGPHEGRAAWYRCAVVLSNRRAMQAGYSEEDLCAQSTA